MVNMFNANLVLVYHFFVQIVHIVSFCLLSYAAVVGVSCHRHYCNCSELFMIAASYGYWQLS